MPAVICAGLPGDWINGWLAAVGATVLDSKLRLHWTEEGVPRAVLSAPGTGPVNRLAERWPSRTMLKTLPIAKNWKDTPEVRRKVSVHDFVARAQAARADHYSWAISSTMTDLHVEKNGDVAHAPFDPAGPGTIKWLHHRLIRLNDTVQMSRERLADSLMGTAPRVKNNGLGFDLTRMGSQADTTDKWVDPVVEILVFFGLALLPVRGRGTDARLTRSVRSSAIQRGWTRDREGRRQLRFFWPAWSPPLDRDGIDAILDLWQPGRKEAWSRIGVHAGWQTVRYRRRASGDRTQAFGAEQL